MHSVDPHKFHGKTHEIDYSALPKKCPLVVITGGEPALFDLPLMRQNILSMNSQSRIEVESNATLFPDFNLTDFFWNLSPKLKSSQQKTTQQDQLRLINLEKWVQFTKEHPEHVIFKFVVQSSNDLREIQDLIFDYKIPRDRVYLMPEGVTPESQSGQLAHDLVEFAKVNGLRFTSRLHILLWGNKRGV